MQQVRDSLRSSRIAWLVMTAIAIVTALPASADAAVVTPGCYGVQGRHGRICPPSVQGQAVAASFKGWGYVRTQTTYTNPCGTDLLVCNAVGQKIPMGSNAYFWSGYGWTSRPRVSGAYVYIHPYTGGWMWTWHDGEWRAMLRSDLRYYMSN